MINSNMQYCSNCHEPLRVRKHFTFRLANYPGYTYNYEKCPNCNSIQFLTDKFDKNEDPTVEELSMLPKWIRFDDTNPHEVAVSAKLNELIKRLTHGLLTPA